MRKISSLEPTRYEITARHADGRELLVVYTSQKSRHGLLKAVQGNASVLFSDDALFGPITAKPLPNVRSGEWTIAFSGRTQRQALNEGERPFVLESEAAIEATEAPFKLLRTGDLLPRPSPLD